MSKQILKKNDWVTLLEMPDGYTARNAPLTIGKAYQIKGLEGSCVVTTTDVPGETATYYRGRVELVMA